MNVKEIIEGISKPLIEVNPKLVESTKDDKDNMKEILERIEALERKLEEQSEKLSSINYKLYGDEY